MAWLRRETITMPIRRQLAKMNPARPNRLEARSSTPVVRRLALKGGSLDAQLQSFLAECHLQVQELVTWSRQIQLQVNSYLGPSLPPLNFITSVRSILMREQTVLVIRDPERLHILPGGRVERGETLEQAIRRELREETGWTLNRITYLGFEHFHHVTAKPAGYRYPYPDFCQAVYAAQADTFSSEGKETNGYELETTFCSIPEVYTLSLTDSERLFLNALLERGDASPG